MSALRVLFVTHAYPRFAADAAGSFLHRLAVALRAGGCEILVLAPSAPGLPSDDVIDGINVHRFRYAFRGMETLAYTGTMAEQVLGSWRGKVALAGMLISGMLETRRTVDRFAPDIVHAHWWFPSGVLALAVADEVPVVTTIHGSDVRLARRVRLVHPLLRRVLTRSAAVTAVSSWLAGETRAMAPDATIRVRPMPVDLGLFTATTTARVPGRLLFVGRLNAQKGLKDLLDALAWTDPGVSLDVVGAGENERSLREKATALGLGTRVHWLGAVDRNELPALYRRSQAVVIPSLQEGLGLVAVEAQLCRTPVIAYRSGGLPDVVSPDAGGALVPPGDTRALADAITRLIKRPDLVEGHGATARATMLDRFAPSTVSAGYRDLYRSLMPSGN